MSSANPDKRTLLAAAIYGISEQAVIETRNGVTTLPWAGLTSEQQAPFIKASEFLSASMFGTDPACVDRAQLAANFEKASLSDANANDVVALVVNLASALP